MIQLQFLNYLITSGDGSLLTSNNLNKDFFSDYIEEYKYIVEHIDQYGNVPDMITFLSKFPNFDVIEVNESADYLLDKLYKDKNTRTLASIFNDVKNSLIADDIDKAVEIYMNSVETMTQSKHIDCVDILKDRSRYEAYLERCDNFDKYYVKTGFPELDEVIGGWDREEELVTIAARSNQGKSWVLFKCAVAAVEQGLNVGLYSGEMSERKVGYRVDTLISNISNAAITKGDRSVQNIYKKYIDELDTRFTGSLKVLTPNHIGGPAGVGALRAFVERENLDILFIDQHSLLEDDKRARVPHEKAANISKDLKNLQTLKKIPIIAVSQQNRNSTENGVGLEHVAQSDRIAQDSTIVLFFEQKDGIMTMHLVKSRDSVNMKDLKYNINLNNGTFIYRPETETDDTNLDLEDNFKIEDEIEEEDVF